MIRYALVALLCACSSAPPASPPIPVATLLVDAAVPDAPIDAMAVEAAVPAVADAAVAAAPEPWRDQLTKPPAVRGPVKRITETKTVTVGGVKITMGRSNHKHYADGGGAVGMWSFTFTHGGKSTPLEIRSDGEGFETELVGHGVFFVLRNVSYDEFDVVLAGQRAPKPLTEEACDEKISKAALGLGLPRSGGAGHSVSVDDGVVHHTERPWVGHCGLYSKRVWFTAARERNHSEP